MHSVYTGLDEEMLREWRMVLGRVYLSFVLPCLSPTLVVPEEIKRGTCISSYEMVLNKGTTYLRTY